MSEQWIVEEVDHKTGNKLYSREFNSRDEAMEIYESLKEENPKNFVNCFKSTKKLLLEG